MYAMVDPVNAAGPTGLCDVDVAGIMMSIGNGAACAQYVADNSAHSVYPYANTAGRFLGVLQGVLEVAAQTFGDTSATYAAVFGLLAAAEDAVPINVTTFSGGAGAFANAVSFLNSHGAENVTSMIADITYISPGAVGSLYNNGNRAVLLGTGAIDTGVGLAVDYNMPTQIAPGCGHDFGCIAHHFQAFLARRAGQSCSHPLVISQPNNTDWSSVFQPRHTLSDQFYYYGLWMLQNGMNQYQQPEVSDAQALQPSVTSTIHWDLP